MTRIPAELLASFDEARSGMTRHLKRRATSRDAIAVLLYVYDAARREGRLPDLMARYHPEFGGLEFK